MAHSLNRWRLIVSTCSALQLPSCDTGVLSNTGPWKGRLQIRLDFDLALWLSCNIAAKHPLLEK
jgi:hypothetical protein